MDIKSQLFDRIRVQAQRKKEKRIEQPSCAYPDCTQPGIYRAPMGRHREGQYLNFCLEHVRLYNATYNYFSGMSDEAIAKYQKEAAVGHRPTWQIGANSGPHLGDRQGENAPPSLRPRSGRPTKKISVGYPPGAVKALLVLDLNETADAQMIKTRYKDLVKRLHPDANGGDRSNEGRLREIIRAYNYLKASKFV